MKRPYQPATRVIIGETTKLEYEAVDYGDVVEVHLRWPSIEWGDTDQLVAEAESMDEAVKAVQRREDLIRTGNTVL